MASGILGTPTDLGAATNVSLYTCPASTYAVLTVSLCNRSASAVTVRISVGDNSTPANADYLEYDQEILPNGVLERTGIVMQAGKILVVRSSGASVSAVAMGIETSTA
jgi:hypothetical protein